MKKSKEAYDSHRIIVPRFEERRGFYSSDKSTKIMSSIGQKDTKPEIILRKALWHKGFRYRKYSKKLPGKPDIVFEKYMLVIFVDGEFWHGYNWEEKKKRIKTNKDYWIPKIERNIQRDKEQTIIIKSLGYTVFRFWDHEINKDLDKCLNHISGFINLKLT